MRIHQIQTNPEFLPVFRASDLEDFTFIIAGPRAGKSRIAQSITRSLASSSSNTQNGTIWLEYDPPHLSSTFFDDFPDFLPQFSLLSPDTVYPNSSLLKTSQKILQAFHPIPHSLLNKISSQLQEWRSVSVQQEGKTLLLMLAEEKQKNLIQRKEKKGLWREIEVLRQRIFSHLSHLSSLQREIPHCLARWNYLSGFPHRILQGIRALQEAQKNALQRQEEISQQMEEIRRAFNLHDMDIREISFPESFSTHLSAIQNLLMELFYVEKRLRVRYQEKEQWEKEKGQIHQKLEQVHKLLKMPPEDYFHKIAEMEKKLEETRAHISDLKERQKYFLDQENQLKKPVAFPLAFYLTLSLLILSISVWLVFSKVVLLAFPPIFLLFTILFHFRWEQDRKLLIQARQMLKKIEEEIHQEEQTQRDLSLELLEWKDEEKFRSLHSLLDLPTISFLERQSGNTEDGRVEILTKVNQLQRWAEELSHRLSQRTITEENEKREALFQQVRAYLPPHYPAPDPSNPSNWGVWLERLSAQFLSYQKFHNLTEEQRKIQLDIQRIDGEISLLLASASFSSVEKFQQEEQKYLLYEQLKETYQENMKLFKKYETTMPFRWNYPVDKNCPEQNERYLIEESRCVRQEIENDEREKERKEAQAGKLPEITSLAEIEEQKAWQEWMERQRKARERVGEKAEILLQELENNLKKDFPPVFTYRLHQFLRQFGWENLPLLAMRDSSTEGDLTSDLSHTERILYSLAFRLSFLLSVPSEATVPLILDDVLSLLTRQQKTLVFSALSQLTGQVQILYFTSHEEDLTLAQQYIPAPKVLYL